MVSTSEGKWHEIWSAVCRNFLRKTGDTMSGALTVNGDVSAVGDIKVREGKKLKTYGAGTGQNSVGTVFGINNYGGSASFYPEIDGYNLIGTASYRFHTVNAVNIPTSSDARLKENISDDLTALAAVFRKLRPVTYTYADIGDGLIRIGFVAQEVESAMAAEGLNADDYAFLRKESIDADSEMAQFIGDTTVYSLNYSEFIALNTAMIQNLEQRLEELERRIL